MINNFFYNPGTNIMNFKKNATPGLRNNKKTIQLCYSPMILTNTRFFLLPSNSP